MNNQRSLLISLLVTAVTIGLVETDFIQFNKENIHAQQEFSDLVLEMDGERVTIPSGDWIVAVNAWNPDIHAGGELVGVTADELLIFDPVKDLRINIPIEDIGILFHGEYKTVWKYTNQGLKYGGLAAVAGGVILGVSCVVNGGWYSGGVNSPIENFGVGFVFGTSFSAIYTVPAGAVIGFIRGLVKKGQASEFVIGPYDWRIVYE